MTLFTVAPGTVRGHTVGVEGETDLPGFAVLAPDGERVEWFHDRATAENLAARLSKSETVRCRLCGAVVTSGDPVAYPYCRGCHYVGNAAADRRSAQLARFIRAFPDASSVGIDHTGGGCFWLAIRFPDTPYFYALTDGEASLPTDEEGRDIAGGWGYVGRHSDAEEDWDLCDELHYNADAQSDPSFGMSDADVIDLIRADLAAR